jgi:hypothetical protein
MLRKRFCELFEIDAPVLQAAICLREAEPSTAGLTAWRLCHPR